MNKELKEMGIWFAKGTLLLITLSLFMEWQKEWKDSLPLFCKFESVCYEWQMFAIVGILVIFFMWIIIPEIKKIRERKKFAKGEKDE